MASPVVGIAIISVLFFAIRYLLNQTDTPKIKNLPEIPGVPIFGNLLQLGSHHATVTRNWAKKYGPVFQTRLGNRVSTINVRFSSPVELTTSSRESCLPTASTRSGRCGSRTSLH